MAGVDVGTAYLTVVPSAKGFSGKLQAELGGGMAAAGSKAGGTAAKGFGSTFKSGIATVAKAGALGLAATFAVGVAFAKDAVGEAREAQKVGALTESVIRSTGGAAKISADQVGDLATAISNKTGIDDEAVQSGANLLLTFKNVKNEVGAGANVFDRATAAAVDLSSAGFGDVTATSKQLGKALNDPIKGVSALGKAGVTFTDQQKKQIKTLVESNRTLDAQKIILGEVESQVGGAAEATATMGEKAAVSFGNLKEQIGTALLPTLDKIQTVIVNKVIPAVSQFFTEMQNGTGKGGEFVAFVKDAADKAASLASFIKRNSDVIVPLVAILGTAIVAFKVITAAVKAYTAVQLGLNLALTANPIGIVIALIALLVAGIVVAYKKSETFRNIVNRSFDLVKIGALTLAKVAVGAFRQLVNFYLTMVSTLVTGAAKAFGWVPGLGPKLKTAAANVSSFKDSANAALAKVEKDLEIKANTAIASAQLNELRRNAGKPITIPVFMSTRYTAGRVNVAGIGAVNAGQRASGGPVTAGKPYWVGENRDGSLNRTSELFVPKQSGTILNQQQLGSAGGGGFSEANLQRLASILRSTPLVASISRGVVDQGIMSGYRA